MNKIMGSLSLGTAFAVAACTVLPVAALDLVPESEALVSEQSVIADSFNFVDSYVDFGRVSELDRSYTKELTIENHTGADVIVDLSVRAHDTANADANKLSEWVTFVGGITHYNIAAGSTRDVNVRVVVPSSATAGSQYAMIDAVDASGHKQTATVRLDINGDNLKYGSEVVDAWVDPVRIDNKLNGRVSVKNTGTAGFTSTYQVKVKNMFGGDDWRVIEQSNQEVFPGETAKFEKESELGFGVFLIEQRVTFVNAEGRMIESLLSRTAVNMPWWGLMIAGGVIVLLIIIIVAIKRHNKKKANEESGKMRAAEKKARRAEIARVEAAEKKTLKEKNEEESDSDEEEKVDDNSDDIEEFVGRAEDEVDEIEQIAEQLDRAEEEPVDDDSDYDEEEAIPIKVTIKKKSK